MAIVSVPYNPWKQNIAAQIGMMIGQNALEKHRAAETGRKVAAFLGEVMQGVDPTYENAAVQNANIAREREEAQRTALGQATPPMVPTTTGGRTIGGAPSPAASPYNVEAMDPRSANLLPASIRPGASLSRAPVTPTIDVVKALQLAATPRFAPYSNAIFQKINEMVNMNSVMRENAYKDFDTNLKAYVGAHQAKYGADATNGLIPERDARNMTAAIGAMIGNPLEYAANQERTEMQERGNILNTDAARYGSDLRFMTDSQRNAIENAKHRFNMFDKDRNFGLDASEFDWRMFNDNANREQKDKHHGDSMRLGWARYNQDENQFGRNFAQRENQNAETKRHNAATEASFASQAEERKANNEALLKLRQEEVELRKMQATGTDPASKARVERELTKNIQQQRGYASVALNHSYAQAIRDRGGSSVVGASKEQQAGARIDSLGQIVRQYGQVWEHPPYQPDEVADMFFSPDAGGSANGALGKIAEDVSKLISGGSTSKEAVAILSEAYKKQITMHGMALDDAQTKRLIERVIVNMSKSDARGIIPGSYGEMRKP